MRAFVLCIIIAAYKVTTKKIILLYPLCKQIHQEKKIVRMYTYLIRTEHVYRKYFQLCVMLDLLPFFSASQNLFVFPSSITFRLSFPCLIFFLCYYFIIFFLSVRNYECLHTVISTFSFFGNLSCICSITMKILCTISFR